MNLYKSVRDLINEGKSHRQIANELSIGVATVSDIRNAKTKKAQIQKSISDGEGNREIEFIRQPFIVNQEDTEEDLSQLDKVLQRLSKKGIVVNINMDGLKAKHISKALPPYNGNPDNVLVISDLHAPYILDGYLSHCREQQEIFDCGTVVFIGDIVDFHSISYHEKIPEELNPAGEHALAKSVLRDWYITFPNATVMLGNHDCHDDSTMVLTNRGFINHNDLYEDDLIGTVSSTGYIEYQEYYGYFKKRYSGNMHRFKGVSTDCLVTPNHRMYIYDNKYKEKKYELAENILLTNDNSKRSFMVAFDNKNEDYDISDDMIEMLGYIYGDGSINDTGFIIYQIQSKVQKIIDCADRLGIGYKFTSRERTVDSIMGKEIKNKTNTHCALYFNKKHSNELLGSFLSIFTGRYEIPEIISKLSRRQFSVFYDALCYCDANVKGNYSQIDGKKEFLKQLEILLISNGYNARICEYREGNYRIVVSKDRKNVMYASHTTEQYDGFVRCLSTPNTNFIVKRNDCISVQGNCLVYRQARTAGLLREFIKDPNTIFGAPSTYNFVDELVMNGVLYTHGSTSNAFKKCILENMNMVSGHAHTQCGVIYHQNRHGHLRGMQVGVGIDYKQHAFDYAKSNSKTPVSACGVVLNKGKLPIIIPYEII